ncbi:MAG: D-alanyl-D-alanine carboxypeptidase [Actinomycetota bacterium]|nr:D-alanyl-D-alanine carboxypeptidase [Actinomycetota bacterium]
MPEYLKIDSSHSARRSGGPLLLASLVVIAVLVVVVVVQLSRGVPAIRERTVLPASLAAPGTAAALPWPKHAAAAVAVDGLGSLGGVRTAEARSLASVAKLFTALVILKQHPLHVGQSGPLITITPADAAAYRADVAVHDSVLKVTAGERLTELQALEGMLIPSADNLARLLAVWSDGSMANFVQAMNNEASALGLRDTHLVGPSGLNPASVGTAPDMVKVAQAVMANPVLRQIVAMPAVTLPASGTVYNLDDVLGRDGVVGIKTGSTGLAGGNFVFASRHRVDGKTVTVLGAILGATGVDALQNALNMGAKLGVVAARQIRRVVIVPSGRVVLELTAPWAHQITARTTRSLSILAIPGERVSVHVAVLPALAQGRLHQIQAGEQLATVELDVNGHTTSLPATASASIAAPSLAYKLERL